MAKVLVEIQVRHVHAGTDGWENWVIEVDASSRKEVTKNLEAIANFFLEDFGEAWTTGDLRVLSAKESKGCQIEDRLELKSGLLSKG